MTGHGKREPGPTENAAADDEDPRICFCMHVHTRALVEAISAGAVTLAALAEQTRAGTGCGTCRIDLLELILGCTAKTRE